MFWAIVFIEALHLYPILYLNAVAALANLDPALDEAAEQAVQREYVRQLQMTATGRLLLAFKPRYGIAAYLLVAAMDASISPLAVVRLLQFRTHGHHLQCKADQFRGDGRRTTNRATTVSSASPPSP